MAAPPSPIADYLTAPAPDTAKRMMQAAALGRLTTADLMAAIVAELGGLVAAMALEGDDLERYRKAATSRHRLLAALVSTIKPTVAPGPVQRVVFTWPAHYTEPADTGEPG